MDQNGSNVAARLILSAAGHELRDIALDRPRLIIGRRGHSDILLNDLTVSGEHAVIRTVNGISTIRDLKSRNGTLLNGYPVQFSALNDGDVIGIGIYRLQVRSSVRAPGGSRNPDALQRETARRTVGGDVLENRRRTPHGPLVPRRDRAVLADAIPTTPVSADTIAPEPTDQAAPSAFARGAGARTALGMLRATDRAVSPTHALSSDALPVDIASPEMSAYTSTDRSADTSGDTSADASADVPPTTVPTQHATLIHMSGPMAPFVQTLERAIASVRNGSGLVAVVARRHAGYYLTHVEGSAYPLVNGESIGLNAHELRDGDLIELSGMIMQFLQDAPD